MITVEVTYDMAKALGGVRSFEVADARTVADAIARAPPRIEPREPSVQLVGDEVAVLLPDDPQHPAATAEPAPKHVPTRFLYRDGAWIAARADSPE